MNDQTKQAMQMALEALNSFDPYCDFDALWKQTEDVDIDRAITALREALAQPQEPVLITRIAVPESTVRVEQPQGEWVDLTWDDYLELAGQERFYVKDPHTGIMDFCSHEFTKAAIELFKDKNA